MNDLGKILMLTGAVLLVVGLLVTLFGGSLPLGRLPGDIRIERPNLRLYVPVTTGLLISAVLTGILYVISRFR